MQKLPWTRLLIAPILLISCIFCFIFFAGCISAPQEPLAYPTNPAGSPSLTPGEGASWMTIPLVDAATGKPISIAELASEGKPILLHMIAIWCPACSIQLRESTKLVQNNPDQYIILAVDIDPRENAEQLKRHKKNNEFEGYFAIAPSEFIRSLVDTMGRRVVSSMPQTIVIKNQSVTYIGDGAFTEDKLKVILSELP